MLVEDGGRGALGERKREARVQVGERGVVGLEGLDGRDRQVFVAGLGESNFCLIRASHCFGRQVVRGGAGGEEGGVFVSLLCTDNAVRRVVFFEKVLFSMPFLRRAASCLPR
jgi:hypothetical protein